MRTYPFEHIKISKKKTVVFIDFETTGFTPWNDCRIIEYSAIKVHPDYSEVFCELAKPTYKRMPMEIPWRITELTGISNEMVEASRDTFEVFYQFYDFIKDCVCIAHNAKFEKTFIDFYCQCLGLENNIVFRDTMPMFKEHFGTAKLSAITNSPNAHMAFDDCYYMIKLMKECQEANFSLLKLMPEIFLPETTKKSITESVHKWNTSTK